MPRQHSPKKTKLSSILGFMVVLVITSLACNQTFFAAEQATPPPTEAVLPLPSPDKAPVDVPEISGAIPPAGIPAIPDCNAFDINAFNAIINGAFSFVTQDQLNNCHFESDNGFRLLIGGGKPSGSDEMHDQFNSSFGALPDSTWEAIADYYLGLAYSTVSITAQGTSASGHSMVIVAASQSGSDPDALKQIFEELAREAAHQLNMQF
ncbi:MAG: hypothetical protein Q8L41_10360 [Anaerolineales bacterium]|nr:hypothetical protein [Anaerolineales bacterium]